MPDQTELFQSLLKSKYVTAQGVRYRVRIEFDGGTPCNIPRLGYGMGYGSYQLSTSGHTCSIIRRNFGVPMSANVAEISTLIAAIKSVMKAYNTENTILEIHGDSKIALNRTVGRLPEKRRKDASHPFVIVCEELYSLCRKFAQVRPCWRGREASVRLFGH